MRLTLRTLLAYLDDILDPADKDELAQKIESSEFAEDLVHRTRDTVRRLRLSAPQTIGTGMGLDPNTVAEYLDNVMPPDAVGDYERICLESDVHLAEAAACHHVLTMVLGEPADVDPLARQRMYTIASEAGERRRVRLEPAHSLADASPAVAAVPASAPIPVTQPPTRTVEIPDYLRTGAWWRSRGALAAVAALLIIGIGIFWYGLSGWVATEPSAAAIAADTPEPVGTVGEADTLAQSTPLLPPMEIDAAPAVETTVSPIALSPAQPGTPGITVPAAPAITAAEPDKYAPVSAEPSISAPAVIEAPPLDGTATAPGEPAEAAPLPAASDVTANLPTTGTEQSQPPTDAGATAKLPSPNDAIDTGVAPIEGAATDPAATPVDGAAQNLSVAPEANAEVPAGPPEFGTYMGGKTVLLRRDDKLGWLRVEPRAAVVAGERLLALPEFRPKIALLSGLHLDMSGGTQIIVGGDVPAGELPTASASNIPVVEVVYGRIVLINPTNVENTVRLKIGESVTDARLRNATLAIEVERKHVAGQDPQQAPAPLEARAFAPEGGVVWQTANGEVTIDKASRWAITDNGAADIVADTAPPEWLDHEPIVQLSEQRYGAPVVESTLVSNRPADLQLLELFHGSGRKEVKSLVARSSIHVGLFEPFIDALRDSEQKANWKTHIEALRSAMALSPESAASVKRALEEQRGKSAANDLYEMLCGYSVDQVGRTPDQMKAGALAQLIDRLEEDSLDYRVLAVHDLWELTGKRLMPNPAAGVTERAQNVRRWRARLDAGELSPPAQP